MAGWFQAMCKMEKIEPCDTAVNCDGVLGGIGHHLSCGHF